jgi:acyl carrier protein
MINIEEDIKKIVSRQLGVDVSEIHLSSSFIKDLGGDSLDTVEMVLELEDRFSIEIEEEVAEKIETVQQAIELVASMLKQAS